MSARHRFLTGLRAGLLAPLLAMVVSVLPAQAQHEQHEQHNAGTAKRRPPPLAMGAAFAPDGALWVVALDAQQRLFVMTSADEGRSWTAPRTLDTGADKIAADGENRPKLVFDPQGWAVITYTEPLSKPYTGQIRMLRSVDGGRSFSAPFTVHLDRQLITHRFESVAFDARGTLHTAWVDKRDLEAQASAPTLAGASDPSASTPGGASVANSGEAKPNRPTRSPMRSLTRKKSDYLGAAIYRNESTDGGLTFGPDIKLADHSCECCRIALAPAPDGSLVALWRHVFAPNQRDHGFASIGREPTAPAVATAAPVEPVRATFDRWAIDACPHHGPGLAPAMGAAVGAAVSAAVSAAAAAGAGAGSATAGAGGYHAVWFGQRAGDARVRYGQLNADGSPRGDVRVLPDERAEHAGVASVGAKVAIAWRSFDGQATLWRAWVSVDDGHSFALKELGRSASDNDHPLLAQRGEQIFALWRTAEGVRVERLFP